jgi:hypothetical protein
MDEEPKKESASFHLNNKQTNTHTHTHTPLPLDTCIKLYLDDTGERDVLLKDCLPSVCVLMCVCVCIDAAATRWRGCPVLVVGGRGGRVCVCVGLFGGGGDG